MATSDALEQVIIMGQGAHRMSAAGLKEKIESVIEQMKDDYPKQEELIRNYLFDYLEKDIAEMRWSESDLVLIRKSGLYKNGITGCFNTTSLMLIYLY